MRILVADDSATTRAILRDVFTQAGHEVVCAEDGAVAMRLLRQDPIPQVGVLDWLMPEMDGLSICRAVRQERSEPYTYIIILTMRGSHMDAVEALDAGADDFVAKPFDPRELAARVRVGQRHVELQKSLILAREELRRQARHDPVTGLLNRQAGDELLVAEWEHAKRLQKPFSVVCVDLDHFKQVNDDLGHAAGDAVLANVAERMLAMLRPADWLVRYGGDEFLVVLPDCSMEQAAVVAERLRVSVSSEPVILPQHPIRVTASFGVLSTDSGKYGDLRALMAAVDAETYIAKRSGRNRVSWDRSPIPTQSA